MIEEWKEKVVHQKGTTSKKHFWKGELLKKYRFSKGVFIVFVVETRKLICYGLRGYSTFMGPIGWVLTALWTIVDIAGPAYRVTVPAVIQIAYIRQRVMNKVEMLFLEAV